MTETDFGPQDQPLPTGGWSEETVTVKNAQILPPVTSTLVQAAGVLHADGSYCHHGALWRRYRPITTRPTPAEDPGPMLEGRWLWGGVLWAHFGHFLVESSSRLWALAHLTEDIDGILFVPKRPGAGAEVRGFHTAFVELIQPGLTIKLAHSPMQVEELIVPGQGFGLGKIIAGTAMFRNAIHSRFARQIKPDGPAKLYVSRSRLGLGKGGLLGEEHLEQHLQAEGYEIFHPQDHSLQVQLARYKAARQIVAADGSAVHLYAMVGRPDQQVAIIMRRESGANQQLVDNVTQFCKRAPLVINALRTEWVPVAKQKSSRLSHGELNHARIGSVLADHGFVEDGADWPLLDGRKRRAMLAEKGIIVNENFVESPDFKKRRIREMRQLRRARRAAEAG